MLIFHEGLPGSGKTYEAMVKHVIPAIERGRRVYAHIDGLDDPSCLDAISECLGLPSDQVKSLVFYLSADQVKRIWDFVEPNSLVVIDEIQNYFPATRDKPVPALSEWVSKHRHDGIDILALGQSLKDVHNLWKRRVDRKLVFQKLDALGVASRYRWVAMKAVGEMRFEKTTEGIEVYQKRFFGTYKSHHSDDVSTDLYQDRRAVLWNSPTMRFALAFIVLGGTFTPWYLSRQFDADTSSLVSIPDAPPRAASSAASSAPVIASAPASSASVRAPVAAPAPLPVSPPAAASESSRSRGLDYADHLASVYRIRLSSVLRAAGRDYVVVEYRDDSLRIQDRLDQYVLQHLGWSIQVVNLQLVVLSKGSRVLVATPWPLESLGEVSDERNQQVSEKPIKRL